MCAKHFYTRLCVLIWHNNLAFQRLNSARIRDARIDILAYNIYHILKQFPGKCKQLWKNAVSSKINFMWALCAIGEGIVGIFYSQNTGVHGAELYCYKSGSPWTCQNYHMGIINSNGLGHVLEFQQTCVVNNFLVLNRDLISNLTNDKLKLASDEEFIIETPCYFRFEYWPA